MSTDYPTATHRTTSWGAGDRDVDDVEQDVADEGTELVVEQSYLTPEQLARVEALGIARTVLEVSGFLGAQPKLDPWALTYVAEYVLKGPDADAEDTTGTDAEQDAPTDGGTRAAEDMVE